MLIRLMSYARSALPCSHSCHCSRAAQRCCESRRRLPAGRTRRTSGHSLRSGSGSLRSARHLRSSIVGAAMGSMPTYACIDVCSGSFNDEP
jgi:hypothetical protein